MNTDIVIPIRGTREFPVEDLVEKCVETVCTHTHNFRFIFIDDGSDEVCSSKISKIASQFPESNLIRTQKQHWFTRAVNLGLRLVRTEYAIELNCDTVVGEGWLDELYSVKDEVEKTVGRVGLVGNHMSLEEPRRYEISTGQDYVTGHCFLLNMAAMQEASFAHGTPGWYLDETSALNIHIRSDVDICWKLNRLGWQTVKSFKSWVGHIGGKSWGHRVGQVQCLRLDDVNYKY
jgi:hypothetical protein